MSKKEKIMVVLLIVFIIIFAFIVILVIANKKAAPLVPVIEDVAPVNDYIIVSDIDVSDFDVVYSKVDLRRISFKNLSIESVQDFIDSEDDILSTLQSNLTSNKEFIDNYNKDNNITIYDNNSSIESTILYDIKDDVLSVLYLVEDKLDYKGINNYICNLLIDINTNNIVTSDELLSKYSMEKEKVIKDIFDNIITYLDEEIDNEEEYIDILLDNFDKYIYLYIFDNNIYLKYNRNDIINFLFDKELETVKYSTMKLELGNIQPQEDDSNLEEDIEEYPDELYEEEMNNEEIESIQQQEDEIIDTEENEEN